MSKSKQNGKRRSPATGRTRRQPTTDLRPPEAASAAAAGSAVHRLLDSATLGRLVVPASPVPSDAAAQRQRPVHDPRRLAAVTAGCALVHELTPHSTAVAYTFTARDHGDVYDVPLRVTGRLLEPDPDVDGGGVGRDRLDITHTVRSVKPGVGEVTVTIRIPDVRPGLWRITVVDPVHSATVEVESPSGFGRVLAEAGPGVSLGAWPATVAAGAVLGISLLGWLAERNGLPALVVILLAILASLLGVVGAKVYYLAQATRRVGMLSSAGMCIQGFVLAALGTLFVGAVALNLPVLVLADLAAPGLMFGMAIGRLGCFYGGCCTGRMTSRPGGLRSSDRYLLARRIPVQLIEGGTSAALGLIALAVLLTRDAHPAGVLAVATIGGYVLARQLLFPLRSSPRRTRLGRPAVGAVSAMVAAISAMVLLAH